MTPKPAILAVLRAHGPLPPHGLAAQAYADFGVLPLMTFAAAIEMRAAGEVGWDGANYTLPVPPKPA